MEGQRGDLLGPHYRPTLHHPCARAGRGGLKNSKITQVHVCCGHNAAHSAVLQFQSCGTTLPLCGLVVRLQCPH